MIENWTIFFKFYKIPEKILNENQDENEYQKLHYYEDDGRYVVPTPWNSDAPPLGHSFRKTVKLFSRQEILWKNNSKHYLKSNEFMEKYIRTGQLTRKRLKNSVIKEMRTT